MSDFNSVNLPEVLLGSFGYKVVREKDCNRWRALVSPAGIQIVVGMADSGNWIWKHHDGDEWKHGNELLKIESPNMLNDNLAKINKEEADERMKRNQELASLKRGEKIEYLKGFRKINNNYYRSYLYERGIDLPDYELTWLLRMSKVCNYCAAFRLFNIRDTDGFLDARLLGISAYYSKNDLRPKMRGKKRCYGTRGISVLGNYENPSKVVILESPIDAISYYCLKGRDKSICFISTCGSPNNRQLRSIRCFLKFRKSIEKLILAFDKDVAGFKMSASLKKEYSNLDVVVSEEYPNDGKDWNEQLLVSKNPEFSKNVDDELNDDDEKMLPF